MERIQVDPPAMEDQNSRRPKITIQKKVRQKRAYKQQTRNVFPCEQNSAAYHMMHIEGTVETGRLRTLVVDNGPGLQQQLKTRFPRFQSPVEVIEIAKVILVHQSDLFQDGALDEERRSRDVGQIAGVIVLAVILFAMSDQESLCQPRDGACTGAVQHVVLSVLVYLRTHHAGIAGAFRRCDKQRKRVRFHDRVVVQQEHVVGVCCKGMAHALVAAPDESHVFGVTDECDRQVVPAPFFKGIRRSVGRTVIHDDDRKGRVVHSRQGFQALQRVRYPVPVEYDDRYVGFGRIHCRTHNHRDRSEM